MGFGRIGNHHKHPGGRGMAGSKHHHKTWVNRWHPGYFGKHGMRHYHSLKNRLWCPAINCNQLWRLVSPKMRAQAIDPNKMKGFAPLVDVVEAGYAKVIGNGKMPPYPLVVRARYFSKKAQQKIKETGGKVLLRA